jgi:hypothetical protein
MNIGVLFWGALRIGNLLSSGNFSIFEELNQLFLALLSHK